MGYCKGSGPSLEPSISVGPVLRREYEVVENNQDREITLIIVYGVNKRLTVQANEIIETVKLDAMELFGIVPSEKGKYALRINFDGLDVHLDETKTVEHYHLECDQKVTLAASAPFGAG